MVVRGINVKSLIFAGIVAGYAMYLVDSYFGGMFGLFGTFPGTSDPWWMLTHHVNSIVFALPFAWSAIYRWLPNGGWLKGSIYGVLWTVLIVIVTMIGRAWGASAFAQYSFTVSGAISTLLVHIVWGFVLGVLYTPVDVEEGFMRERAVAVRNRAESGR